MNERTQATEISNRDVLKLDEVIDILKIAKENSIRDWTLLCVCFRHALRSAEVAELKWSDIDWQSMTLTVQRKKGGMRTEQQLFRTKGEPILDEVAALKAWKSQRPEQVGNDFIFTTQKSSSHIRRETVTRMFRDYSEQASQLRTQAGRAPIPSSCFHIHALRHARATLMANTPGVEIWDVKALLGHATIQATTIYCRHDMRKACSEAERSVVEALA